MKTENAWKKYEDRTPVFEFNEKYKNFMSACKTERECVEEMKSGGSSGKGRIFKTGR